VAFLASVSTSRLSQYGQARGRATAALLSELRSDIMLDTLLDGRLWLAPINSTRAATIDLFTSAQIGAGSPENAQQMMPEPRIILRTVPVVVG
jgi:hypothetical protein